MAVVSGVYLWEEKGRKATGETEEVWGDALGIFDSTMTRRSVRYAKRSTTKMLGKQEDFKED